MSRSRENASNKFKRHLEFILKYKTRGNLLDIGFAKGDFLKEAKKISKWNLFGIDISKYAINTVKNHVRAKLRVIDLNKQKLPFKDNFFDVIYASEIFEHLLPKNFMLREMFRCLKPNGFFFLTVPNRPKKKPLKWDLTCGHINLHNKKSITREFHRAGFNKSKIKVRYEGLFCLGILRRMFKKSDFLNKEILLKNEGMFKNKKSLIVFGYK